MRDKARSLPALAAAIGLLGAGALGVPASVASPPDRIRRAVAPAASGRPDADLRATAGCPILGTPR